MRERERCAHTRFCLERERRDRKAGGERGREEKRAEGGGKRERERERR